MFAAVIHAFRHYADFSSRDPRALYWKFISISHLILIALAFPMFLVLLEFTENLLYAVLCEIPPELFQNQQINQVIQELPNLDLEQIFASEFEYYTHPWEHFPVAMGLFVAACVWGLSILLPTISATVRRLRDAGQSPLWVIPPCLCLIPLLSVQLIAVSLSLVTLVFCLLDSQDRATIPPPAKGRPS